MLLAMMSYCKFDDFVCRWFLLSIRHEAYELGEVDEQAFRTV